MDVALFLVCLCFIALVLFIVYSLWSEKTLQRRSFKSTEYLPVILVRVLFRALRFKQGDIHLHSSLSYATGGVSSSVGDTDNCTLCIRPGNHKLIITDVRIDKDEVSKFRNVCGYPAGDTHVPVVYPQVLFFRSLLLMVSSTKFGLSPLGLIHIRETIKQHDRLSKYLGKTLEARSAVTEYREFDRGVEVDMSMKLYAGNTCIWEAVSTLFSRAKARPSSPKKHTLDETIYTFEADLDAPSGAGVAYARVSGDWNPHHLYSWTALPMGFKRPIAHGMWTLSRALSTMHKKGGIGDSLLTITCSFKRPLLLPGNALIKVDDIYGLQYTGCCVRVEDRDSHVPHLIANVKTS